MDKEAPHVGTLTNPVQRLAGCKTDLSCASWSQGVEDRRPLIHQRQRVGALFRKIYAPDPTPNSHLNRRLHLSNIVSTIHREFGANPPPPAVIEDVAKQVLVSMYKDRYSKKTNKCSLIHVQATPDSGTEDNTADSNRTEIENTTIEEEFEFESFSALQNHLKFCDLNCQPTRDDNTASLFGINIRVQNNFFPLDLYRSFKQSLFEQVLFVQERRRENRRAMSTTKRLYAVYGFEQTGMMYSNFSRASVNSVPTAIGILFHRLKDYGHSLDTNCCVMISCYPPSSADDMTIAIANDRDTFCAMKAHKDDDVYLGERSQIEVLTLSGFIDPQNYSTCCSPIGWQFFVCNQRGHTEYINLCDNMLLTQPRGMQCFLKHGVLGVASPFVRWVVTIRRIDKDVYNTSCRGKEKQIDDGQSLTTWIDSGQWHRTLRPTTHKQLRKSNESKTSIVSVLYPGDKVSGLGKLLLLMDSWYYCASCDMLAKQQLHGCLASNSVIFGPRPLQIGESYTMQQLIAVEFSGWGSIDAAFEGDAEIGCTSMVLTKGFVGNDYSKWLQGYITVAGARESLDYFPSKKINFRNRMVICSLVRKLPVEVVVEEDEKFVYTGTWYVQSQWIAEPNIDGDEVTLMFGLVPRSKFRVMTTLDCNRGFNDKLRSFFRYVASNRWPVVECAILEDAGCSILHHLIPLENKTEQDLVKTLVAKANSLLAVFGLPDRAIDSTIIINTLNSFVIA